MPKPTNYNCPQCDGRLKGVEYSDFECVDCGCLIIEQGERLIVDHEPDSHGSVTDTHRRNHAEDGMGHE